MMGTEFAQIGVVKGIEIKITGLDGTTLIQSAISELRQAWKGTFEFLAWRE